MASDLLTLLTELEPRLRSLLTAELYARTWVTPAASTLMKTFEHLRTLLSLLQDYVSKEVSEVRSQPGQLWHSWLQGTLLFTDLAGFTSLVEASATQGPAAAEHLLTLVNQYFSTMVEIISKSGGNLLEFTGDAMLVQFPADANHMDTIRAIHAGLRMQRAMQPFMTVMMPTAVLSLQMRVGIHAGQFLAANVGTPLRMDHVLLGQAVQLAKLTEGNGQVGRVCLTTELAACVSDRFRLEPWQSGYALVVDDLADAQLGEYDLAPIRRRLASPVLLDRSPMAILKEIQTAVNLAEPLACYLPRPVLRLLVDHVAQRQIPPQLVPAVVMFVNLQGLPEAVDGCTDTDIPLVVDRFSTAFALLNAVIESRGGVLQKVTYYAVGSNVLIHFGVLNATAQPMVQAVAAAIAIRQIIHDFTMLESARPLPDLACRIGITAGLVFAAEIGEPRGRREFNILGDPVNTAARLVSQAQLGQILIDQTIQPEIASTVRHQPLGTIELKGKAQPVPIFEVL